MKVINYKTDTQKIGIQEKEILKTIAHTSIYSYETLESTYLKIKKSFDLLLLAIELSIIYDLSLGYVSSVLIKMKKYENS